MFNVFYRKKSGGTYAEKESCGKLRRYIDFQNFVDLFRVVKGCFEARRVLKKLKPDTVFSNGGFVSVPVILAAKSLGIPIYIHESDMTPGLANRISQRFSTKIFTSFKETKKFKLLIPWIVR